MPAETAATHGPQELSQQPESQEVHRLVGELESRRARLIVLDAFALLIERGWRLLIRVEPALVDQALNDFIQDVVQLLAFTLRRVLRPFFGLALRDLFFLEKLLHDR